VQKQEFEEFRSQVKEEITSKNKEKEDVHSELSNLKKDLDQKENDITSLKD